MIIRIVLLIAIGYAGFRLLKSWVVKHITMSGMTGNSPSQGSVDDILIQDPVCKVYFSKKTGVHLYSNGKDLYFCSDACRQKYISENKPS
jgi:YHS domain-containing protein